MLTQYTISRDLNGNRIVRVRPAKGRGFSIQTNGNLPETDRNGVCAETPREVADYVKNYGTARQRAALGIE